MRHYLMIIAFAIIFSGCVSMPEPINDAHLVEKTSAESAKLDKIEQSIIAKKKEMDDAKNTYKISEQKKNVKKGNIKILEKKQDVLLEEKKLHEISKDGDKLGSTRKKIEENVKEIKKAKVTLKYNTVLMENALAIHEVKKTELAMLIAELSYEKAKIANKFLINKKKMKKKPALGKKKEEESFIDGLTRTMKGAGHDTIDEEKYEKYMKKQQELVKEKKAEQNKIAKKLAEVKKEIEEL